MMSENKMHQLKKNPVAIILIIILSLLLSVLTSSYLFNVKYDEPKEYTLLDGAGSASIETNDAEYVTQVSENSDIMASFNVEGEDPYILLRDLNISGSGVYLSLTEQASEDINIKVYWTRKGDEALSEKLSRETVLHAGDTSAYIKVSGYELNLLRIDIDSSCEISMLCLADARPGAHLIFGKDMVLPVILRFVLIALVLFLSYLSFLQKKEAQGSSKAVLKGMVLDPKKEGRKYEYDYIRTLAAVMVIMMHSICDIYVPAVSRGDGGYGILRAVLALSLGCNVLYIMLSGALILGPRDEGIGEFYVKRMVRVLIPMLCYFGLYMFLGYRKEIFSDGVFSALKGMGADLLSGRPAYMPHLWLVYTILGLYILAPFIRILLKHITDGQLFGLLIAGFVCNVLVTYLPLKGLSFGIDIPVAKWLGIFLLGYYMTTDHAKKFYNAFMVLGLVGVLASFLMIYFDPDLLAYTANWTPNMWLVGCGVFAFFSRFKNIFGKRNVVIAALSKYNFSIMLIHILLLMKIVLPIGWRMEYEYGHLTLFIVLIILVCLILSYIGALLYDNTAVEAAMYVYNGLRKKFSKENKGK